MARDFVPSPFDPNAPGAEALPVPGTTYRVEFHGTRPGMRAGFNSAVIVAAPPGGQGHTVRITAIPDGMEEALVADYARLAAHPPVEQARFLYEMKWQPRYEGNAVPEFIPAAPEPVIEAARGAAPAELAAAPAQASLF